MIGMSVTSGLKATRTPAAMPSCTAILGVNRRI
jgi:hypothetical protein